MTERSSEALDQNWTSSPGSLDETARKARGLAGLVFCGTDEPPADGFSSAGDRRARVIARLAEQLADLVAEGDVEGARVVHEAIGRLLPR